MKIKRIYTDGKRQISINRMTVYKKTYITSLGIRLCNGKKKINSESSHMYNSN